VQIQEQWSGFRARTGKPVGWLWSAAWGLEGENGLYMAVWRRAEGTSCLGQALVGAPNAMRMRFAAEVEHKQKEGYCALGRRNRRGLPKWKDGSAVKLALEKGALGGSPTVQAWVLREQLLRADSRAGVESLWEQYQTLRARLEARVEYGEEVGRGHAQEVLEALVVSMRQALA
jgi:hypothetical protein